MIILRAPYRMKTKSITIQVPAKYKWLAVQPDGATVLYECKPKVGNNGDYYDEEETQLIEFWCRVKGDYCELDEISLGECEHWRTSLRKI
jgi:hypothetical protein